MANEIVSDRASALANQAEELSQNLKMLANQAEGMAAGAAETAASTGLDPTVIGLTVFVLACFVGYYVVWRVTPALHSPLMGGSYAISSVIIVGALIAAGPADFGISKIMGFIAGILASVNIFGGFIVTQRMLSMFKKKQK